MKNENLLASISLFAELCNNKKDIRVVLNEFIKSVFSLEKIVSADSNKVKNLLDVHFGFVIPEGVIKSALNSLRNQGAFSKHEGQYYYLGTFDNGNEIRVGVDEKLKEQTQIEKELLEYIKLKKKIEISDKDKETIFSCFSSYLLDAKITDDYSSIISQFVINRSSELDFISALDNIREGVILYQGIVFSSDLNELDKWNKELIVYLDTELLFNSYGINGELYQKLFDDFYELVKDINLKSGNNKKLIHLKYFSEVEQEIQNYFYVAEKILLKEATPDPSKPAMIKILEGCSTISDIVRKKADLFDNLKSRGISEFSMDFDPVDNPQFNIIDNSLLERYIDKHNEEQSEKKCLRILEMFSKIKTLRGGVSNTFFENVGHIILTGKGMALQISQDLDVKNNKKDIPFATDIYFVTSRLWFKLNKGFNLSGKIPSILSVVAKAQVILASQINDKVSKKFSDLKKEVKDGTMSTERAQSQYYALRSRTFKPEDITESNVNEVVDFIFEDDFEKYLTEKSHLENKAKRLEEIEREAEEFKAKIISSEVLIKESLEEKEIAQKQAVEAMRLAKSYEKKVKYIELEEKKMKLKKCKRMAKTYYCMCWAGVMFIAILSILVFTFLLSLLKTPNDTPLSIAFGIITTIALVIAVVSFSSIKKGVLKDTRAYYISLLNTPIKS